MTTIPQHQKHKYPNFKMGYRTYQTVMKDETQLAKKHIKKGFTSLSIRKMKIQIYFETLTWPFRMTSNRITITKKLDNKKLEN